MAWFDDLVQASFNGVGFKIDNTQKQGGRRIQNFEFANRDDNATIDHGRKTRKFTVNCFVIGDDWAQQRDRLQDELEKPGIGEFLHPSKGIIRVRCEEYSIDEDMTDNGRMAVFSISFIEAGKEILLKGDEDLIYNLTKKIADVIDLSKNEFTKNFDINGQPQSFVDSVIGGINRINNAVDNSAQFITDQGRGVAVLNQKIETIKSGINELLKAPEKLSAAMADAMVLAVDSSKNTKSADLILNESQKESSEGVAQTANRKKEISNKNEVNALSRRVAIAKKVDVAVNQGSFENIDVAYKMRNEILESIESELNEVQNYELFSALSDLRKFAVDLIPNESQSIPKIKNIRPVKTLPSLVVVFNEFGSIDKNDDFVKRNNIENPCFVSGASTYEVLE